MATKYINFDGIAYWTKVTEDEVDEYLGRKKWTIDLVMDEENLQKYVQSGIQGKIRDIGQRKGVRFIRDKSKVIKGEEVEFNPPNISIWSAEESKYIPFGEKIGNGSKVRVSVQVYEYTTPDKKTKKGSRLMSITVLDFMPRPEKDSKPMNKNVVESAKATPWG